MQGSTLQKQQTLADLTNQDIFRLLEAQFAKIGKEMPIGNLADQLIAYTQQRKGFLWVSSFERAFDIYIERVSKGGEELKGNVSVLMLNRILQPVVESIGKKKFRKESDSSPAMEDQRKWNCFVRFIKSYFIIPAGSDWIAIMNHLTATGIIKDDNENSLQQNSFTKRLAIAEDEVRHYAEKEFAKYLIG